jgi:hypothetical protein
MPASRAQRAKTAERRRQAVEMRLAGATLDQIVDKLDYADRAAAHKDITRAMEQNVVELAQPVEVLRETELQRLDVLWAEAWAVLKREHVTVSHGKIVYDERSVDGEPKPLLDDGPVLQAISTLLKIQERRAKFLGLDSPVKVEAITIDSIDAAIAKLAAELEADQAGEAAGVASAES